MAAVIHDLWERQDAGLMIMPASVPIDAQPVQFELTRYMDDSWVPVIEKDVNSPCSLPLDLDRNNPNLGRYSACRRVARTLYMGSGPTVKTSRRGLEDRALRLGCARPGERVARFGGALHRLTDNATHLYVDGHRYWFSTQPSVARVAQDRAAQYDVEAVRAEIVGCLRLERDRGDFVGAHVAPGANGPVPDEMTARLVVLGPEHAHTGRVADSTARREAERMLASRGSAPRQYRNMLVFLAPDAKRMEEPEVSTRTYLAWKAIARERNELNLDAFQGKQAITKGEQTDATVTGQISEAYSRLPPASSPAVLRRFHGVAELDTMRIGRDAGRIAEEIVQHLSTLPGARVRIRLEIEAEIPDGAPDNVVRTVSENGRTLKLISQGFEEE